MLNWNRHASAARANLLNVVDAHLSQRVMTHLLQLPLACFTNCPSGTLVNRLHGVERIREFAAGAFLLSALELPSCWCSWPSSSQLCTCMPLCSP